MQLTDKQRKAVEFIMANPGAEPMQVIAAAGASRDFNNAAAFIWRLLANGSVRLEVEPELRMDIEEGII